MTEAIAISVTAHSFRRTDGRWQRKEHGTQDWCELVVERYRGQTTWIWSPTSKGDTTS